MSTARAWIFSVCTPRFSSAGWSASRPARRPLIFGDGTQTMDFVYVEDIARANVLAANADATDEVFNVASGVETSLNDLAQILLRAMGSDAPLEYGPERKVNAVPRRLADVSKARQLLGFQTTVSIEEGMRRLVAGFRHRAHPRHCRCGAGAGDRLGRRRHARASGRGHPRRPRHRRARGLDLPLRRALRAGGQGVYGAGGPADATRSLSKSANGELRGAMSEGASDLLAASCPHLLAQRSAASSRSLPQNNSPSAVMKLGAPNRPSRCASSVCARSRCLMASEPAAASTGCGSMCKRATRSPITAASSMRRPSPNCARNTARRKTPRPSSDRACQRDPRCQQAVLGKGIGAAGTAHRGRRTAARGRATCSRPFAG